MAGPIQELAARIKQRFPDATLSLDSPTDPEGPWFLDVSHGDYSLVIEWRANLGLGLSSPEDDSFGEGPDEVYPNVDFAWERVRHLILARIKTRPPEVPLPDIRTQLGVS